MRGRNAEHFIDSWRQRELHTEPYRHWLVENVLPEELCRGVLALPFDPPAVRDTQGKRATNNDSRAYFNEKQCKQFAVCGDVVDLFLDREVVESIEETCAIRLRGSSLRVEYAQDCDGFWLAPHPDVKVKLLTMLIYLGDSVGLGTDIYDSQPRLFKTAPFRHGLALVFVPAGDTWHGFKKRPIPGVRRSIIVNYVTSEWRDRYELAGEV